MHIYHGMMERVSEQVIVEILLHRLHYVWVRDVLASLAYAVAHHLRVIPVKQWFDNFR